MLDKGLILIHVQSNDGNTAVRVLCEVLYREPLSEYSTVNAGTGHREWKGKQLF